MSETFTLQPAGESAGGYPRYEVVRGGGESEDWLPEPRRRQLKMLLLALGVMTVGGSRDTGDDNVEPAEMLQTSTYQAEGAQSNFDLKRYEGWGEVDGGSVGFDEFTKRVEETRTSIPAKTLELILQNAQRLVAGGTLVEYLQSNIEFEPWDEELQTGMPPVVQEELRRILPGMCAQESRFALSAESKRGALGLLQVMPEYWKQHGGDVDQYESVEEQVRIGGLHLSQKYRELVSHLTKDETLARLRTYATGEEDFERHILVPLLVNSYHSGAGRVAAAVREFFGATEADQIPLGKELIPAIIDYARDAEAGILAGFRDHSADYVAKVYAQAGWLEQERLQKELERVRMAKR